LTLIMDIWPDRPPGDEGEIGEEHFREPWSEETKGTRWLTNVTRPTIAVYRPEADKDTGAAALVCPGGGYWNLAWDLEGEEIVAWLNSIGVSGILLKYRVPRRPGQPERLPAPFPLQDAQRALRIVRSRAGEWGIDPERIGMIGFSAGGHLSAAVATNFDRPAYPPIDDVDKVNCRPDFAVLIYPGYLAPNNSEALAPYVRIPVGAPPFFLTHAGDDSVATADNSVLMYLALKRAGIPAELHVYASGGHGFGARKSQHPCCTWPDRCLAWLQDMQLLPAGHGNRQPWE
jgi:acetyl esterase/lipase